MAATIETSADLPPELFEQAQALAQDLNISPNELLVLALADFINHHPARKVPAPTSASQPPINQGDIYWVQLPDARGAEPGIPHPHVVVQDNLFNHSRITTVVMCALTSNSKRASLPGHVLLEAGEANLTRPSVVETSKISTVEKTQLGAYIGSLTEERIRQILAGLRFLQTSFLDRSSG